MLVLTWHIVQQDGEDAKRSLNLFLTALRRKYGPRHYLWIAEFQQRGSLHFHIYLEFAEPGTFQFWRDLAVQCRRYWNKVTHQTLDRSAFFHGMHFEKLRKNDPGSVARYVMKECCKLYQKNLPQAIRNKGIGRWWGTDRNFTVGALARVLVPDDRVDAFIEYLRNVTGWKELKYSSRVALLDGTDVFQLALNFGEQSELQKVA